MLDTNTRYSFILACNKALEEKPLSCAIAVAYSAMSSPFMHPRQSLRSVLQQTALQCCQQARQGQRR